MKRLALVALLILPAAGCANDIAAPTETCADAKYAEHPTITVYDFNNIAQITDAGPLTLETVCNKTYR